MKGTLHCAFAEGVRSRAAVEFKMSVRGPFSDILKLSFSQWSWQIVAVDFKMSVQGPFSDILKLSFFSMVMADSRCRFQNVRSRAVFGHLEIDIDVHWSCLTPLVLRVCGEWHGLESRYQRLK